MRLAKIRIQNFRSFKDETISLSNLTTFVGPNGTGKSNVLTSLNIFFRNHTTTLASDWILSDEDFHNKNTADPIVITLTFNGLSANAQEDLKAYFRNGELTVSAKAVWDAKISGAKVEQYGARLVLTDFARFFKAADEDAKVSDLKGIYTDLRTKFQQLPAPGTKAAMIEALRGFEEANPDKCELRESSDLFYGWSKGVNLLGKYIQWVYIPAVKDASTEQDEGRNTALGALLSRTIRSKVKFEDALRELKDKLVDQYKQILDAQNGALTQLSESLQKRLEEWSRPGARVVVSWTYDPNKSLTVNEPFARALVGEGQFLGEVGRLGHGVQRTFIVSLLQELASGDAEAPQTLLLGFEEPELYQHPPQARHLASLLEELAGKTSQILVTTHSPYFVSTSGYTGIRRAQLPKATGSTKISGLSFEKIQERLKAAMPPDEPITPSTVHAAVEQIMQPAQNELFFSTLPILVEGPEDVALISTYLQLSGRWRDFRRYGCHFVKVVGKINMSRPLAIASELGIPSYAIFDSDIRPQAKDTDADNLKHNNCILALCGVNPLPTDHSASLQKDVATMFAPTILAVVKDELRADWTTAERAARVALKMESQVSEKNPLILTGTLEELWRLGKNTPALETLCAALIARATVLSN